MHTAKHWLITGGAGFIGSALARRLAALGQSVTVLDDFSAPAAARLDAHGIRVLRGSILDEKILRRACQRADYVLHLAAVASVAESFQNPARVLQVNLEGTALVLQAAQQAGVRRVLFASSSAVYGSGGKSPRRETMLLSPLSPYALSKQTGEELCTWYAQAYGLDCVITRCFNVYGPGQDASSPYAAVLGKWTARARRGQTLTVHGDGLQTRDFIYISDAAEALLRIAQKGKRGEIYNVGSGKSVTLNHVLHLLEQQAGRPLTVQHGPAREGDVRYSSADIHKLRSLGFVPRVPLCDGLQALWQDKQHAGKKL